MQKISERLNEIRSELQEMQDKAKGLLVEGQRLQIMQHHGFRFTEVSGENIIDIRKHKDYQVVRSI